LGVEGLGFRVEGLGFRRGWLSTFCRERERERARERESEKARERESERERGANDAAREHDAKQQDQHAPRPRHYSRSCSRSPCWHCARSLPPYAHAHAHVRRKERERACVRERESTRGSVHHERRAKPAGRAAQHLTLFQRCVCEGQRER
jgi:hypothetical protein